MYDQIEIAAQGQLTAAFVKYPKGCDEDKMRDFLNTGPYPSVAWELVWGRQAGVHREIAEALRPWSRFKKLLGLTKKIHVEEIGEDDESADGEGGNDLEAR